MIIFRLSALNLSHCWSQSHGWRWDLCSGRDPGLLVGRHGIKMCERKEGENWLLIYECASNGALQRLRSHFNVPLYLHQVTRVHTQVVGCSQIVTPDMVVFKSAL